MVELYQTGRNSYLYEGMIPRKGNMDIGFPRKEKCRIHREDYIHLKGPPISVYHPDEYDSYTFRAKDGASYETAQYGVVGIYSITNTTWITSKIDSIDDTRTTIILSGSSSYTDDDVLVYYYADHPDGGFPVSNINGDELIPEAFDHLSKVYNDAMPIRFGQYGSSSDSGPSFRYDLDMGYRVNVNANKGWNTLLDYSATTGTWRPGDVPFYVTEITIKIKNDQGAGNVIPITKVEVSADGSRITGGFSSTDSEDILLWSNSMDPADYPPSGSSSYNPGALYSSNSSGMVFDNYQDRNSPTGYDSRTLRLSVGMLEIIDDLNVRIYCNQATNSVSAYVRGWHNPYSA